MWRRPKAGSRTLPRVVEGGFEISGSARCRPKDRLVLRSVRQSARVHEVRAAGLGCSMCSARSAWGARAAKDGAGEVICVDSSRSALEFAVETAPNSLWSNRKGDAFDVLEALVEERARFDMWSSTPAFAKPRRTCEALAAYKRLNQLALRLLADDGIWCPAPARIT